MRNVRIQNAEKTRCGQVRAILERPGKLAAAQALGEAIDCLIERRPRSTGTRGSVEGQGARWVDET
jgi:hypothetical protein